MPKVKVFGADWCPLTQGTLSHLRSRHIAFDYIDIDSDRKAAKWVASQNGGKEKKPTLDIDGEVITEPTNKELDDVLAEKSITS